jgi:hypothetical protein
MDKVKENALIEKSIEAEDLIAELCLGAPSECVKFCLRNYQYDKSISQIEKDVEREKVQTLRDTAQYLNIPKYELKTKKLLAHLIICRIQNLLPENCTICNDRYRISISETPLLECCICGQGVHTECWTELAKVKGNLDNMFDLNAASFQDIYNPLKLPGMFYICKICQESTIPDDDSGNTKRKPKEALQEEPVKQNENGISNTDVQNTTRQEEINESTSATDGTKEGEQTNNSVQVSLIEPPISFTQC